MSEPSKSNAEAGVLDAPLPQVTVATAQRLVADWFGIDASVTPLSGERDRNFRAVDAHGVGYVLKFTHPSEPAIVTDFQVTALMRLAERVPALPLPRAITSLEGNPAPLFLLADGRHSRVRLSSYLWGTPLANRAPCTALRRALGSWLAEIDDALQDFQHPAADYPMPWDLQRADALLSQTASLFDAKDRHLIDAVLRRFAEHTRPRLLALPRQPIHNDLNNHNVLFDANRPSRPTGIIDFGDMLFAPRIVDLAVAAAYQMNDTQDPLAGALALIEGYHHRSPLTATECDLLKPLMETRMAMAISVAMHRARQYPSNADYLLRNTAQTWSALRHSLSLAEGDMSQRLDALLDV